MVQTFDKTKNIVFIDMDNTIADLDGHVESLLKLYYPMHEWDEKRLQQEYPESIRNECTWLMGQPKFYESLRPIEGAVNAVKEMISEGYNVMFVSNPLRRYEHSAPEKYRWIEKFFGPDMADKLIMTKDKSVIGREGDIFIEDRPDLVCSREPLWEHVLFDQSYNRSDPKNRRRLCKWEDWKNLFV